MTQIDGKLFPAHGLEEYILLKMSILPKAVHRFNSIHIQSPMAFFAEIELKILILGNHKELQIPKATFRRNKTGGIVLPGSKLYYKVPVTETVWY